MPQLWKQFDGILNRKSLVRILVLALLVGVPIVMAAQRAFPLLDIVGLWRMLFMLPGILLLLALELAMLSLIFSRVLVRSDKILIQHSSAQLIDPQIVTATYLIFHPDNKIRLRIHYCRKSRRRCCKLGMPPTVDLERLSELLPISPVVRDARTRSFSTQNPTV